MGSGKTRHARLIEAAAAEDIADIDAHVANGANVNEKWNLGDGDISPLIFLMAGLGKAKAVRRLVRHGADVNAKDSTGLTALQMAIIKDQHGTVKEMLQLGADPNVHTGKHNQTALHTAALQGNAAIVQLLLAHGADPNAKGNDGITPLLLAANQGHLGVARLLS